MLSFMQSFEPHSADNTDFSWVFTYKEHTEMELLLVLSSLVSSLDSAQYFEIFFH